MAHCSSHCAYLVHTSQKWSRFADQSHNCFKWWNELLVCRLEAFFISKIDFIRRFENCKDFFIFHAPKIFFHFFLLFCNFPVAPLYLLYKIPSPHCSYATKRSYFFMPFCFRLYAYKNSISVLLFSIFWLYGNISPSKPFKWLIGASMAFWGVWCIEMLKSMFQVQNFDLVCRSTNYAAIGKKWAIS